jgi:hypothetical protein
MARSFSRTPLRLLKLVDLDRVSGMKSARAVLELGSRSGGDFASDNALGGNSS